MKTELPNTELPTNTADGVAWQSTTGAGGCKIQCETDRPCHIYVATLRENGKAYIGITTRKVTTRWKEHWRTTIKKDSHFGNALRKYGIDAFDWEWLGTFESEATAGDFEKYCIAKDLTHYNSTSGGDMSDSWRYISAERKAEIFAERDRWFVTRETRAKMSAAKKGKPSPRKGAKCSDETRRKMSESATGRKHSDEAKEKRSLAGKGRKHTEEAKQKVRDARAKQVFSDETKVKMSCSRKGAEPWNKGKQVMTEEQKEHLRQINLGKEISSETRLKISKALTGRDRKSPSQEVRDRISATLMGNVPWNKGKELSEEHCKALSLSHMGKKQSPEVIAKRTASRLATLARKKEEKLLHQAMGSVIKEVVLDG